MSSALAVDLGARVALVVEAALAHRAEQAARAEAEKAVRLRDDLLAIVSHDLRNPLSAIDLAATLLTDGNLHEASVVKRAKVIRRSVETMQRLIEDLLDLARIRAGTLGIATTAQSPQLLLREAGGPARPLAIDRRQTLVIGGDAPEILVDRDRIIQVLSDLVGNAISTRRPRGGSRSR